MNNSIEQGPERIPSHEEVISAIKGFAENAVFVREKTNDEGLYLLLMKAEGEKSGEYREFEYMRKGNFPHNQTATTHIDVTEYVDDFPISGYNIAEYNSVTGEFERV